MRLVVVELEVESEDAEEHVIRKYWGPGATLAFPRHGWAGARDGWCLQAGIFLLVEGPLRNPWLSE